MVPRHLRRRPFARALSRKIWQKIMILPKGDEKGTTPAGGSSGLGAG